MADKLKPKEEWLAEKLEEWKSIAELREKLRESLEKDTEEVLRVSKLDVINQYIKDVSLFWKDTRDARKEL